MPTNNGPNSKKYQGSVGNALHNAVEAVKNDDETDTDLLRESFAWLVWGRTERKSVPSRVTELAAKPKRGKPPKKNEGS